MKKLLIATLGVLATSAALAKLPAPTDEAKAKADEAKAKTVWADKVSAYKLCLVQDKVAGAHLRAKGGDVKVSSPACQDPGPYVAGVPASSAPLAAKPMTQNAPMTSAATAQKK